MIASSSPAAVTAATPTLARALAMWGLASSFFLYAFVQRVSPSVMVDELMRDFAVGAAVLGHLSAFYFYAYAVLQIPIGLLLDRFGGRRLMVVSLILAATGSMLFASATTIETGYAGRLLIGAGVAASWVGALTVAGQWLPPARFALFAGFTQALGMAGAVFGQAPLALAVAGFGWRATLAGLGAIAAALGFAIWIVVRDRVPPAAAADAPRRGRGEGLRAVMAVRETWLCTGFGFTMTGGMLAFGGLWGVPFLQAVYGLDRPAAAGTVSLLFAAWGVAAPAIGWFSDRIGRRRPLLIGLGALAAAALAVVVLAPPLPYPLLVALIVVHGASASVMILGFALVRERNDEAAGSTAMGVMNTAVVGAGAVMQPLIGALLDAGWDGAVVAGARVYAPEAYRAALVALPIVCALGVVAAAFMRENAPVRR